MNQTIASTTRPGALSTLFKSAMVISPSSTEPPSAIPAEPTKRQPQYRTRRSTKSPRSSRTQPSTRAGIDQASFTTTSSEPDFTTLLHHKLSEDKISKLRKENDILERQLARLMRQAGTDPKGFRRGRKCLLEQIGWLVEELELKAARERRGSF